ncbi:tRNA (adenosine(37)-N6)-threonylcarbamoyltransferase complex transferase subunit TsaD [Candidatus Peregrinibacteria bacterium]|jgi:N6-L-threonylcarbamoyladenine synthase|nr:tRNA (adenosine(37)-N6)-threonylcarbamoyltransferase complex transferase subunit TsaD [Candidatus Peregrinibacteria bacterium]MBT7703391.1 tRNA (adenosine(37)-N6)-threonylcarbamoyltransferase complex transferase subunit TsaD [Candidatus Peregrinibacteria bacterium]
MLILGIETSCDETAAAVVENGQIVRSNIIASQIDLHRKTGGVVPEVAAREHVPQILPVIDEALTEAGVTINEIDGIAVTQRPGLISSLLVGTSTANTLALIGKKPLIPINHIEGHIYANWLDLEDEIKFPMMVLTVSGGHNELVLIKNHGDLQILGSTRDDAAGEAFDKVARLLGLPYPGGPEISRLAEDGDKERYELPRAMIRDGYDFSFSGLKSATFRLIQEEGEQLNHADLAASFQEAVCDVLSAKLLRAAEEFSAQEIHLAGGVSANKRLRELTHKRLMASGLNIGFRYPQKSVYCTDNAAMIAGAGYFEYQKKPESFATWQNIEAEACL